MIKIEKNIGLLAFLMFAFVLAWSIASYAQGERNDHHDRGRHEGWYKHEDSHHDRDRYERGDRHEDRRDHRGYREDNDYRRIRYRDRDFYFHGDRFYERRNDGYIIVEPPFGFRMDFLPSGYRVVRYRRIRYYVVGGMYFRFMPSAGAYIYVRTPF